MKKKRGKTVTEMLVKWRGLGAEEASWVKHSELMKEYLELEGKVI